MSWWQQHKNREPNPFFKFELTLHIDKYVSLSAFSDKICRDTGVGSCVVPTDSVNGELSTTSNLLKTLDCVFGFFFNIFEPGYAGRGVGIHITVKIKGIPSLYQWVRGGSRYGNIWNNCRV